MTVFNKILVVGQSIITIFGRIDFICSFSTPERRTQINNTVKGLGVGKRGSCWQPSLCAVWPGGKGGRWGGAACQGKRVSRVLARLGGGKISSKVTPNRAPHPLSHYNSCWNGNSGDIGKFVSKRFKSRQKLHSLLDIFFNEQNAYSYLVSVNTTYQISFIIFD